MQISITFTSLLQTDTPWMDSGSFPSQTLHICPQTISIDKQEKEKYFLITWKWQEYTRPGFEQKARSKKWFVFLIISVSSLHKWVRTAWSCFTNHFKFKQETEVAWCVWKLIVNVSCRHRTELWWFKSKSNLASSRIPGLQFLNFSAA